ncbi:MAG TPA: GNAT family N-acetyltransferase [Candidatus Omnitrophota bacterium]|nr:GNAT family N-acetyltransferase [Candidatus Omnitrophota bacterium]
MADSDIEFEKVCGESLCHSAALLAKEIWTEYYIPIIGQPQVEYMIQKFQSKDAILRQINEEGYLYYLIKDATGGYLGYFGVIPRKDCGEMFLSKLYIKLHERKKGYGKAAMCFIEALSKAEGLGKIVLTVNKNNLSSIKAYLKLGFEKTESIVADIGGGFCMDDFRMVKTLA